MAADPQRDPIASPSQAVLGWYEEVIPGVSPASPRLTKFRRTGGGFELRKDAYDSAEMKDNRQTSDSRHGIRRPMGDVATELSAQSYDPFWEALMGCAFASGLTLAGGGVDFDSISSSATNNSFTFAGLDAEHGLQFGDRVAIAGAANAALNGTWTVIRATTAQIFVAEDLPTAGTDAGVGVQVTRLGKRLVIGNIIRTFGFEEALGGVGQFQLFEGVRVNTAAINLPPTGIATCRWGFVAQKASGMVATSKDGLPPLTQTQSTFGTLTFSATARTIAAASGDFTSTIQVGDQIRITGTALQHEKKVLTVLDVAARLITVGESLQAGTATTYQLTRMAVPSYLPAPQTDVMVAASGLVLIDGDPIGTVTALNFTVDNGMQGATVVGSNTIPQHAFGPRQGISGKITALFQEGGLYDKYEGEVDCSLIFRLDDPDGRWMQYAFPRLKLNSATLDRSANEGIPISLDIVALESRRDDCEVTNMIFCTA